MADTAGQMKVKHAGVQLAINEIKIKMVEKKKESIFVVAFPHSRKTIGGGYCSKISTAQGGQWEVLNEFF